MKTHALSFAVLGVLGACALVAGCSQQPEDPRFAEYRGQFLLADEPEDVTGVIALREELAPAEGEETAAPPQEREVALVGVIGGVEKPWSDGHATFVIVDPSAELVDDHDHEHGDHAHDHSHGSASAAHSHSHAHDHDHAHCAFCKAQGPNMEALAVVQFSDADGKVLPLDARKLFGITEKQMVVVRGKARLDETQTLIIAANGLYVRQ